MVQAQDQAEWDQESRARPQTPPSILRTRDKTTILISARQVGNGRRLPSVSWRDIDMSKLRQHLACLVDANTG